jgi:hypothetical protein
MAIHIVKVSRREPVFGERKPAETPPDNDRSTGCGWLLLISVGSYFVYTAIDRVLSGTGSRLDQIICYGVLIALLGVTTWVALNNRKDQRALESEKHKWVESCVTDELNIMARHEGGSYCNDDGYDIHSGSIPYRLELEMNADQKAVSPEERLVSVTVSEYTYQKLATCKSARVYYLPEAPLTFLLEDEL